MELICFQSLRCTNYMAAPESHSPEEAQVTRNYSTDLIKVRFKNDGALK